MVVWNWKMKAECLTLTSYTRKIWNIIVTSTYKNVNTVRLLNIDTSKIEDGDIDDKKTMHTETPDDVESVVEEVVIVLFCL